MRVNPYQRNMGLSREVIDRASKQGGYITRSQLLDMGHSPGGIDWLLRSGTVKRASEGVYEVIPPNSHIDLVRGAILALPDAVVSHQSAAHILALPVRPNLVPTVCVAAHTTHVFPGVMVRRCNDLETSHVRWIDGLTVTSVPRTMFDLAGILEFREFDQIAEAALIDGRMSMEQFDRLVSHVARKGKRGSRASKDFIAVRMPGDPRSTVLERKGRRVLARAGLPAPTPQFPIPWNPRRRFDDAYPDERLALEWDSRGWHQQRRAMRSDRRRDREAAIHGWRIVRFTWEDVTEHPREVASTVARLLALQPSTE
jgi:hypothetical protein